MNDSGREDRYFRMNLFLPIFTYLLNIDLSIFSFEKNSSFSAAVFTVPSASAHKSATSKTGVLTASSLRLILSTL